VRDVNGTGRPAEPAGGDTGAPLVIDLDVEIDLTTPSENSDDFAVEWQIA
jgi:hypothetical protein